MNKSFLEKCDTCFQFVRQFPKPENICEGIRCCDTMLRMANQMPSPKRERELATKFFERGLLNCARSSEFFERGLLDCARSTLKCAHDDFSTSLKCGQDSPESHFCRSLTSSIEIAMQKCECPNHMAMNQGWFDITNVPCVENNPAHLAHVFIEIWRKHFCNTGFFPGIMVKDLWQDFSAKFPKLYHVVPKEHEHSFAREGHLIFQTLSELRNKEDPEEGALTVVSDRKVEKSNIESCVFCLSRTPHIASVRKGGIIYEIVTERLMHNLLHCIEFCRESLEFSGVRYFSDNLPCENKQMGLYVSAGIIYYGKQVGPYPSVFVKNLHYSKENEVRIAVDVFSHGLDSAATRYRSLTLDSGFPVKVPNPAEWCRKS